MRSATLLLFSLLALFLFSAQTQEKHRYPTPPEPLSKEDQAGQTPSATEHIDLSRVQQEADDLARMAQTIPTDLLSVRKGMFPKDTLQKLKQIQKLSKRLRTELNP